MWNIIGGLFKDAVGIFADSLRHKRAIKEAQVGAEIAMASRRLEAEISWDVTSMENQRSSWKDEWFVLLLSVPLVMAFIPGMEEYVQAGFENLQQMPDYYMAFVGVAVSASFGYRKLADPFIQKLSKPKLPQVPPANGTS